MWADVIVILAPRVEDPLRIDRGEEHVRIEAFVAQASIEALDKRILDRMRAAITR
jgi:hypothetical protein